MINRRGFVKLLTAAVAIPSLAKVAEKETSLPAKMKYKGFDVLVMDAPWIGGNIKQVYASNDEYNNAVLVYENVDWEEIEKDMKLTIDRHIRKQVA